MAETEEKLKTKLMPNKEQAFAGAGIIAALIFLQPLKDWFPTREEFTASTHRISSVEQQIRELSAAGEVRSASLRQEFKAEISQLKTDLTAALKASTDLFLQRNTETTTRTIEAFRAEFAARDAIIREVKDEVRELRKPANRR